MRHILYVAGGIILVGAVLLSQPPSNATVTRIVDGDTIEVEFPNGNTETVRYIGVDTPEVGNCYAGKATQFNRELVHGERVKITRGAESRDKYGRLLAHVYVDGTHVNRTLVAEGYADTLAIPPNVRFADELRSLKYKAQRNDTGLWGACN